MHPLKQFYANHGTNQNQVSVKTGISVTTLANYVSRNTEIKKLPVGVLVGLSEITESNINDVYQELIKYEEKTNE